MMNKIWSPSSVPAPAANYHQCALIPAGSTRLHIAGQLGIDSQGMVAESAEEQIVLAWKNLRGVLQANQMDVEDLISVRLYLVDRNDMPEYQAAKQRLPFDVGGLPTTLLFVSGLFDERWKVEIEAEAAKVI
ncbi:MULTISPECIES: RidA family protein [Vibrio]|jgi:enamine deaminase RidA (YjgF/YER057c/UK114 family)|uniref:RidA family protein n=1 Tax=Vibrio splendidus TaxID=29497 RepID=A0A7Y4G2Z4_VIBSP|nr:MULTISPECIES: RidA family protein [Vibrio]MCF7485704.1 RidA family protein [Vibrio sp. A2-1]NOJ14839.1 RidA family protein [Vibrio splendidus]TVU65084.1 RidA family protein [Vibrio atlanticus]|tara:strand:- start:70 stop:465 length:396 start_codon:yes stop_codon:yes gene_type:complete